MYAFWKNGTNAFTIAAAKISKTWSPVEASWTLRSAGVNWTNPGGDYGTRVTTLNAPGGYNVNVWDAYTVTSAIQDFVNDPSQNFGLMFICVGGSDGHGYYTADYSDISKRPKLTVTYAATTGVSQPQAVSPSTSVPPLRVYQAAVSWSQLDNPSRLQVHTLNGRLRENRLVSGSGALRLAQASGTYVVTMDGQRDVVSGVILPNLR